MTVELPAPERLDRLPFFPLPGTVFFPHSILPLHIFEPRYREMTAWCIENDSPLAVVRIEPGHEAEQPGDPPVSPVCGVGSLAFHERLEDGRYVLFLQGLCRVRIVEEHPREKPFRFARTELVPDDLPADAAALEAPINDIKTCLSTLIARWPAAGRVIDPVVARIDDPAVLADSLASFLFQDPDARQALLETPAVEERLARVRVRITQVLARTSIPEGPIQ